MKLLGIMVMALLLGGCTEQQRAKQWGGEVEIELPAGQKLVVATWKDSDLWYLIRPMRPDEQPERYRFQEDSSFGVLEGQVIFIETR